MKTFFKILFERKVLKNIYLTSVTKIYNRKTKLGVSKRLIIQLEKTNAKQMKLSFFLTNILK